ARAARRGRARRARARAGDRDHDGRPHRRRVKLPLTLASLAALATTAHAERPIHGSLGGGSALLLTADDGNRLRYELELDLEPRSRYGGFIAWRGFDEEHRGMLLAGLVFEAGAARP